jgi:lambda family phage portal protein
MNVSFSYTPPAKVGAENVRPVPKAAVGGSISYGGPAVPLGRGLGGQGNFNGWGAVLDAPGANVGLSRDETVARSRDLITNDPSAKGALRTKADMIVGAGFIFTANIDHARLGITRQQATMLNRALEQVWNDWAYDPLLRSDTSMLQGFGLQTRAAYVQRVVSADGLGVLGFDPLRQPLRTSILHVDSDRLSTPIGKIDGPTLRHGVAIDPISGAPVGYHFRNAHPNDMSARGAQFGHTYVPRRDVTGRPVVLHLFDPDRPGAMRGIGEFVAALSNHGRVAGYTQAELENAAANALFLGVITSNGDPFQLAADLGLQDTFGSHGEPGVLDQLVAARNNFYPEQIAHKGSRFAKLAPGDDLKFATTPRQTDLPGFTKLFEQGFAASIGISAEQYRRDFTGLSYSAIRGSMNEVARSIPSERARLEEQWLKPTWMALIEDALDLGAIQDALDRVCAARGLPTFSIDRLPSLYEAPRAWTDGTWTGPGQGTLDATKEQEAADAAYHGGVSSLTERAADMGKSFEMVLQQRQREREQMAEFGEAPPSRVEGGAPQVGPKSQSNVLQDAQDKAAMA